MTLITVCFLEYPKLFFIQVNYKIMFENPITVYYGISLSVIFVTFKHPNRLGAHKHTQLRL